MTAPSPDGEDEFEDICVSDAMRAYLVAFDDYLMAEKRSDRRFARDGMSTLCDRLLKDVGVSRRERREAVTTDDLFGPAGD